MLSKHSSLDELVSDDAVKMGLSKATIRSCLSQTHDRLAHFMLAEDRGTANLISHKKISIKNIEQMPGFYYAMDTYIERRTAKVNSK